MLFVECSRFRLSSTLTSNPPITAMLMCGKNLNIRKQRGLSLVELMIAMLLGLIVSGAIITVFTNNKKSFNRDEDMLGMLDDARHALRELAFDVGMAGHYADLLQPSSITNDGGLTLGTDCGPTAFASWAYATVDPGTGESLSIAAVDNATTTTTAANHSCITNIQPGTDIIAIKRVAGATTAAATAGNVFLRTNGTVGLLFQEPAAAPAIAVPPPFSEWQYRPRIYFVRNFANTPGDGIPTLCRKVLTAGAPAMATECLAMGIENLQIEYGFDSDFDGRPNAYLSSPTQTEMQSVVSVRIFVLARTVDADVGYTNSKTYNISNAAPLTPADNFHRRVISTTVNTRNVRSLQLLGS